MSINPVTSYNRTFFLARETGFAENGLQTGRDRCIAWLEHGAVLDSVAALEHAVDANVASARNEFETFGAASNGAETVEDSD